MTQQTTEWFQELCPEAGSALRLQVTEPLHAEQSHYQKIEVYQTTHWGRRLVIDGLIMLTQRDNFLYHEMLAHPALFSHPAPRQVAIIGGGDCGTLLEVAKHPEVERIVQIDIDERVTRVAEQFFPELCAANQDPRVELLFLDGTQTGLHFLVILGALDVLIAHVADGAGQEAAGAAGGVEQRLARMRVDHLDHE